MIFVFLLIASAFLNVLLFLFFKNKRSGDLSTIKNLHIEISYLKEKIEFLTLTRTQLEKTLQDLCNQALLGSQNAFLSSLTPLLSRLQEQTSHHFQTQTHALNHLAAPLQKTLKEMAEHIQKVEQERIGTYSSLKEQVAHLIDSQKKLNAETHSLAMALRSPHIRGCWGEMQLRRVVELSGMVAHCDFQEQETLTKEGQQVRPDLIIRLSNEKLIIVDAKAPLLHYLEASSADTAESYQQKIKAHAAVLLSHMKHLSDKKYWSYEGKSVEFVLLFLPAEAFLSAALQVQPDLLEIATERQLILATPTLLIALLKVIAQGWQHQRLSEHTEKIVHLGRGLHHNLVAFQTHFSHIGKALKEASRSYQGGAQLIDETLLPLTQQLQEAGVATPLFSTARKRKNSLKQQG
jgi:DNA recombination protein RmuC